MSAELKNSEAAIFRPDFVTVQDCLCDLLISRFLDGIGRLVDRC
jgi:hypothetical protein